MKNYSHGQVLKPIEYDPGYVVRELPPEEGEREFRRAELAQEPPVVRAWADTEQDQLR